MVIFNSYVKLPEGILFTGWWLTYPSEKYEFVSWQDDIPNTVYGKKKVPNHQPVQ